MVWANRKHLGCRYPPEVERIAHGWLRDSHVICYAMPCYEVERAAGAAAMADAPAVDSVRWT